MYVAALSQCIVQIRLGQPQNGDFRACVLINGVADVQGEILGRAQYIFSLWQLNHTKTVTAFSFSYVKLLSLFFAIDRRA